MRLPPAAPERHDWRFLLPARCLDATALVVGDDGSGAAVLRASEMLASVAASPADVDGPVDLLVVLARTDLAADTMADLGRCVGPATTVVVEQSVRAKTRRRVAGHVDGLAAAAGLVEEARYVVAPDHGAARWMAPLDRPIALRWYLATAFIPGRRRTAVLGRLVGLAAGVAHGRLLARGFPHQLVVLGPPAAPRAFLAAPSEATDAWTPLLLGSSQDARSRAVVAWFPAGATTPTTVVKVSASPEGNDRNRSEQDRLARVRSALASLRAADSVPHPEGDGLVGALQWIRQSASTVQSLDRVLGNVATDDAAATRALAVVADWVTTFAQATESVEGRPVPGGANGLDALVATPMRRLVESAAVPTGHEVRLRAVIANLVVPPGSPAPTPLPVAAAHFDLAPCNVAIDPTSGAVTVIDWEAPYVGHALAGYDPGFAPAGIDLWFFTAYACFGRLGAHTIDEEAAIVADLVRPRAELASWVRSAVDVLAETAARLGYAPDDVTTVWVLLWWQRYQAALVRAGVGDPDAAPATPALTRELEASLRFLEVAADGLGAPGPG